VFHAGRIQGYDLSRGSVIVTFRSTVREEPSRIEVARIVNCSGPATDYEKIDDPLVAQLIGEGIARPDPLRLGLDVADNLHVIGGDGNVSELVYAVGPPTKGALWEITAVPDLRTQVELLARTIASELSAENTAVMPAEFCAS
jgi:uncharacterized NAD(P)/FAD-binding protein YdhS